MLSCSKESERYSGEGPLLAVPTSGDARAGSVDFPPASTAMHSYASTLRLPNSTSFTLISTSAHSRKPNPILWHRRRGTRICTAGILGSPSDHRRQVLRLSIGTGTGLRAIVARRIGSTCTVERPGRSLEPSPPRPGLGSRCVLTQDPAGR